MTIDFATNSKHSIVASVCDKIIATSLSRYFVANVCDNIIATTFPQTLFIFAAIVALLARFISHPSLSPLGSSSPSLSCILIDLDLPPSVHPLLHIKFVITRRLRGPAAPVRDSGVVQDEISGGGAAGVPKAEQPLEINFGYDRNFVAKYELNKEVGRGIFGQVCSARIKGRGTAWWLSRSSPKLRCHSLT
ncbi:CDPK-related protein kinase [Canna indica]|uniref:CDPK-related protein kinase n=1 Tax=Canna indica TaxID=4628 RepID=A0AAQ3Q1S0_9LILI|nr:CDPK-related protein kinase [Canna indica]